jgi:acyl-CoA synthetase (AMP-forming)/AMP-acid ligase II
VNIAQLLTERAAACGSQPAILDEINGRLRTLSFAELESAAARAATQLRGSGLRAGDSVLVLVPMSVELYVALSAIFRLGLVAMFLDPADGRANVEACCAINPPVALIGSPKAHLLRFGSPSLRRIPIKFSTGRFVFGARSLMDGRHSLEGSEIEPCGPDTPAMIRFTSGTTGPPKAAVRTHGFLLTQQSVLERSITLTRGEVDLTTMPIFCLANLAAGVTSVIANADMRGSGTIDPEPIVEQMAHLRATRALASPEFFERIAEFCERTNRKLEDIEKIFTGGSPVIPKLLERLQSLAPRAEVVAVYGSTEAEPIAHVAFQRMTQADLDTTARGGGLLAGVPVPEIEVKVLRDKWGEPIGSFTHAELDAQSLPAGETGEIVVSGPHVLGGYLHGRGDSETKFRVNGAVWHRTGDAGYFDRAGRLWLMGRCAAKISSANSRGHPSITRR